MLERSGFELLTRTKKFALRIIRLFSALPRTPVGQVIGRQLIRSGTSVGAQYREACRARSDAEFVSKLSSALQELEETAYWIELLIESETMSLKRLGDLKQETDELIAMFVASIRTVRKKRSG